MVSAVAAMVANAFKTVRVRVAAFSRLTFFFSLLPLLPQSNFQIRLRIRAWRISSGEWEDGATRGRGHCVSLPSRWRSSFTPTVCISASYQFRTVCLLKSLRFIRYRISITSMPYTTAAVATVHRRRIEMCSCFTYYWLTFFVVIVAGSEA